MAYVDEPGSDGPEAAIVDPSGQLPAIWFQQMDAPRLQRNASTSTLQWPTTRPRAGARRPGAGGRLVDDSFARSFWVLADAEGNEGVSALDRPR